MIRVKHIYKNYANYIKHQKNKLNKNLKWIIAHDKEYEKILSDRLGRQYELTGKKVLCLGSRLGGEVKAFINNGAFAIGIDLNPGKDNKYVVCGDFQNIQYRYNTFDYIFINCLDHCYDLDQLIHNIYRLLVKDGVLIVEINNGIQEGFKFKQYETLQWDFLSEIDDKIKTIFTKLGRFPINFPFNGEHIFYTRSE